MCKDIIDFIKKHELPDSYAVTAEQWFYPVIEQLVSFARSSGRAVIVGINGSQGSGKSTLADLISHVSNRSHDMDVLVLSIDDFYLTHDERKTLATEVHPLLQTRGVPGTHDIDMALDIISRLKDFSTAVSIPRFDKSRDDRLPAEQWDVIESQPDIIVLEGWCVGAEAQDEEALMIPVNELEAQEDSRAVWRSYVNRQLLLNYQKLFKEVDVWIMLKAPSFECVFDWRLEQEEKLARVLSRQGKDASGVMDGNELVRFIQCYQRITESTLRKLPEKVHFLYDLDRQREIIKLSKPSKLDRLISRGKNIN